MSVQVHEDADQYELGYDEELDAVVFRWKEFARGEDFKRGANAIYEYFQEADSTKVLVDTSGIKAHADEDGQWLLEDWTPRMIEAGMEYNCIVNPESTITQMDRNALKDDFSQRGYNALWTDDMAEARAFLRNNG